VTYGYARLSAVTPRAALHWSMIISLSQGDGVADRVTL